LKQFLIKISDEDFVLLRKEYIGTITNEAMVESMLTHHGPAWHASEIIALNDITGSEVVEVSIRDDGKVLWVNSEKGCVLRICRIKQFVLDDRRMPAGKPDQV